MTIYLDMDGTIAGIYNDPNWLAKLEASDVSVYADACPLVHFSTLARYLNRLQARGYRIGIISWLSKSGTDKFNAEVAEVKREWLAKHLHSVQWDEIHIVPYGVPKSNCATCPNAILFDDEQRNLNEWMANTHNMAYNADLLMEILRNL
jgi:hypothetical protein